MANNGIEINYDDEGDVWSVNIPERPGSMKVVAYVKHHADFKRWVESGGMDVFKKFIRADDFAILDKTVREQIVAIDKEKGE